MVHLSKALESLRPGSEWSLNGDTYEGLNWISTDKEKPTEAELLAECARLQAEYEANEYQRLRATEYPSIADQLDMLYHDGLAGWKKEIDKVKNKYPKPEGK